MSSPADGRPPDESGRLPSGPPPGGTGPAGDGQPPYTRSPYDGPATPQEPPYVYNPYGNYAYPASYPSPAGLGPEPELPPKRPGSLHLALLLLVVAALPYLFVGLAAVVVADQAASALPPEDLAQLQELGVDIAQVVGATGVGILATGRASAVPGLPPW